MNARRRTIMNPQNKPADESRIDVFVSTLKELFGAYGPRVFLVISLILTTNNILFSALEIKSVFETFIFTTIITAACFLLCAGYALHVAILYRKDRRYRSQPSDAQD